MSTNTLQPRMTRWIPISIIVIVVAGILGYFIFRPATTVPSVKRDEPKLAVPEGEAGKAGDLFVTQEAMDLAEIKVEPAVAKLVSEELTVNGIVQAGGDQMVKVTPRSPGKVVKTYAGAGDRVRAGQTLALLESSELGQAQSAYRQATARSSAASKNLERQRQLAQLGQFGKPQVEEARTKAIEADRDVQTAERDLGEERTKLLEAQSELRGLAGIVKQTRAELEVSKSRYERAESLFKEELISRQELERLSADFQKAVADVEVSEAALTQGEARIEGAKRRVVAAENELRLSRQRAAIVAQGLQREERVYSGQFMTNREVVDAEAAVRLAQVDVRGSADAVRLLGGTPGGGNTIALTSPISGRVQERTVTLGETIDPEHAAFTVVNLDQVWAQLAIAPRDLTSVRMGDQVELTSEAAPGRSFRGTVLSVGTQADESTRTVSIRTTLGNASQVLKPGAFVRGHIVTDVRNERITVPVGALQDHTGRPTVYVAMDKAGAFEVRHVKLGVTNEGWREVTEGLRAGERVAATGTFYLKSEALKDSLADGCCAPGT